MKKKLLSESRDLNCSRGLAIFVVEMDVSVEEFVANDVCRCNVG